MDDFPMLKYGSQNTKAVIVAQGMLWDLGFFQDPQQVDGIFGSETKSAVMIFQHEHKLSEDGIIGQDTWRVLLSEWWCIK